MYHRIVVLTLGTILLCFSIAVAQNNQQNFPRPEGHAPISIMGDHYHKKGELMFSYRFMSMWMDGNLKSDNKVSTETIGKNFMVVPQTMNKSMHMLGVMYAPSNQITLMLSGNYISNTMNLRTKMGVGFKTESSGLGDITLSSLIKIINSNGHSLHGNVGVSIPTGSINQRDATPILNDALLAYPMQLGSGTWDPSLGLTYLGQSDAFSWGGQSIYKIRMGQNAKNYTFGNRLDIVSWAAVRVSNYFSFSTSLSYFKSQKIKGLDTEVNPKMMPLFNTANSGRSQVNFGVGANFLVPKGNLKNLRLALELNIPTYQKVNGIQMKNKMMATFGIQYAIGH